MNRRILVAAMVLAVGACDSKSEAPANRAGDVHRTSSGDNVAKSPLNRSCPVYINDAGNCPTRMHLASKSEQQEAAAHWSGDWQSIIAHHRASAASWAQQAASTTDPKAAAQYRELATDGSRVVKNFEKEAPSLRLCYPDKMAESSISCCVGQNLDGEEQVNQVGPLLGTGPGCS